MKYRFVKVGKFDDDILINLAYTLNSLQNEFVFFLDHNNIELPSTSFDTDIVKQSVKNYMKANDFSEYPIAVCNYEDEIAPLSHTDERGIVININKSIEDYLPYDELQVLAYLLSNPLIDSLGLDTPVHYTNIGCPMDIWGSHSAYLNGLQKSDFCNSCNSLINQSIFQNKISFKQITSIYKILDYVANRKYCFVIMPFAKSYNKIYNKIKTVLEDNGRVCVRADEIYQTKEILNIIFEHMHRAELIIADLTDKNPNVFYELGYAHSMDKNTILLTQNIDDVPFDLRNRQLIEYTNSESGLKKLSEAIMKYLR